MEKVRNPLGPQSGNHHAHTYAHTYTYRHAQTHKYVYISMTFSLDQLARETAPQAGEAPTFTHKIPGDVKLKGMGCPRMLGALSKPLALDQVTIIPC